jgi:hypothetical protein
MLVQKDSQPFQKIRGLRDLLHRYTKFSLFSIRVQYPAACFDKIDLNLFGPYYPVACRGVVHFSLNLF